MSIDLGSAFDKVEREFIFKTLERMNIPKQIIESIKLPYKSIRMQIKGSETGWFKIGRGVQQGSSLSGLIFTICLAPILRRIKNDQSIPSNLERKDNGLRACIEKGDYEQSKRV